MSHQPDSSCDSASSRSTALELTGSLLGLMALAIIQPVFEMLGDSPEFFIARAAPQRDALMVTAVLGVLLPIALASAVIGLQRLHRGSGELVHGALVVGFGTILGLHVIETLSGWDGLIGIVVALGMALILLIALKRSRAIRKGARWGVVLPGISVALFIVASPISRIVLPTEIADVQAAPGSRSIPVTVIVFDELPTASLMSGPGTINRTRFPHFADFADDAVWYPNATTTADMTFHAIPALLTGRTTPRETLPIAADHPESIFTLLSATHDIRAVEDYTRICPAAICESGKGPSVADGLSRLFSDTSLVAAHVVLPAPLTEALPPVDGTWGRSAQADGPSPSDRKRIKEAIARHGEALKRSGRPDRFRGVVTASGDRPPATILHSMLPHYPFRYVHTGQRVTRDRLPWVRGVGVRGSDEWLARHAQARHLLQTGVTDRVLGRTIEDLREADLYEPGLVVVVADHGVSFEPGSHRRYAEPETLASIAAVPLMVKYPHGDGGIDRRPAQTIDVLPTVLDVVGAPVPEGVEGTSLRGPPPLDGSRTLHSGSGSSVAIPEVVDPWDVGRQVQRDFGTGWRAIYEYGPYSELLGRRREAMPAADTSIATAALRDHDVILEATPTSDPIPAALSARLTFTEPREEPMFVAVVFDGHVVGVGRTYDHRGDSSRFTALVPPEAFEGAVDEVDLLGLRRHGGALTVTKIVVSAATG